MVVGGWSIESVFGSGFSVFGYWNLNPIPSTLDPRPTTQAAVLDAAHAEAGVAAGGGAALVAVVTSAAFEAVGGGAHRAPSERLGQLHAARRADRLLGDSGSCSIHSDLPSLAEL
jgi:hypothetical protein